MANAGPGPDKADRAAERAPAVAERREKPETAASRRAQIKATPLPPPAPAPPDVPRAEGDDARAVLARLRQSTSQEAQHPPAQAMAPAQATAPAQAVAPAAAPRGPVSPFVVRLNDARAALGVGRLDDARRLLQEVQLSLVFRPVGPDGAELPNASTGAADVARALEALGVNDVQRGRQYVDRALDAVTGAPIRPQASAGDGGNRSSGYAPAYPPR